MAQPQTVTGSFDDMAEAQQSVQLLLSNGFPADHVDFSTKSTADRDKKTDLTVEERSTGRFLTSIFGSTDNDGSVVSGGGGADESDARNGTILVTVQVQSALDVERATHSLKGAMTVNVSQLSEE